MAMLSAEQKLGTLMLEPYPVPLTADELDFLGDLEDARLSVEGVAGAFWRLSQAEDVRLTAIYNRVVLGLGQE